MKTRRQMTNQDAQRAKHRRKRRGRGPVESMLHGERSQSGVKIRSKPAWQAWLKGPRAAALAEADRIDALHASWRKRAAAKRAA